MLQDVVDWCGCSPNDFKLEDFARIRNTAERNLFFARKFEPVVDQRIVDRVEQWLYPKRINASNLPQGHDMYWQSLYHYADLSPLPDDVVHTLADSLARLAFFKLGLADDGQVRPVDVHVHFKANAFRGILVRARVDLPQGQFPKEVEAFARPRERLSASRTWLGKVARLFVGTDYDQKESIFRNFLGGIGPLSGPVLAYEFDPSLATPANLTALWVDPLGRLAGVSHFLVDDGTLVRLLEILEFRDREIESFFLLQSGHVRPRLSEKLVTGKWQLLLASNDTIVAKSNFVVVPLAYWRNEKISLEKAMELHGASTGPYEDVDEKWRMLLQSGSRESQYQDLASLMGSDLRRRIDGLLSEQYEIKKICVSRKNASSFLTECVGTDWSSLSPDEKSDVRSLCRGT